MRTTAIAVVLMMAGTLAYAQRQGAIGDSISVGTDAHDDGCTTTQGCALQLGADAQFSWTTGTGDTSKYPNFTSMRMHWNYSNSPILRQGDGKRWLDANGQAQGLTGQSPAITRVTIEMGGNDVCRGAYDQVPSKAEIQGYIHTTLGTLTSLPAGSRVILAAVPNISNLKTTMASQHQFLWETCQDLWDLDSTYHVTAVAGGFCEWQFFGLQVGSTVCNSVNDFANVVVPAFINPLKSAMTNVFGVQFPCGSMLASNYSSSTRAAATQLNTDINDAMSAEVSYYNGSQSNVHFHYIPDIGTYQFTAGDVSHLDCFHPSRQGQGNMAAVIWQAYYNQVYNTTTAPPTSQNATAPALTAASGGGSAGQWSSWWTSNGTDDHQINTQFNATKGTRVQVYLEDCWNASSPYYHPVYIGQTTNENPDYGSFGVRGITDSMYNDWWSTDVVLIDSSNNTGPFTYSPRNNPNWNGKEYNGRWCI